MDENKKDVKRKNFHLFNYANIKERLSLAELQTKIHADIAENKVDHAMPLAGQAAIYHGIAGLLLHHQARVAYLIANNQLDGINRVEATRCLKLLLACKTLYEQNNDTHLTVEQHFPEVASNPNLFWSKLETQLTELGADNKKAKEGVDEFLEDYKL